MPCHLVAYTCTHGYPQCPCTLNRGVLRGIWCNLGRIPIGMPGEAYTSQGSGCTHCLSIHCLSTWLPGIPTVVLPRVHPQWAYSRIPGAYRGVVYQVGRLSMGDVPRGYTRMCDQVGWWGSANGITKKRREHTLQYILDGCIQFLHHVECLYIAKLNPSPAYEVPQGGEHLPVHRGQQ